MATGYIARPDTRGRYPIVMLLGGVDGLTSAVKDLARQLARHGYVVIAPNLYRDLHPGSDSDLEAQLDAYNRVPDRQAIQDVTDAISWIVEDDAAFGAPGPFAIFGIDVGGRLGLIYAAHHQDQVASLIVAYPPLAGDEHRQLSVGEAIGMLPMAVLGLFGGQDELVPVEGVDEAQSRNPHGQWLLYDGAGHDFLNAESDDYDAGAAGDAVARIIKLLAATLPEPVRQR